MIDRYAYASPLAMRPAAEKVVSVLPVLLACFVARSFWIPLLAFGFITLLTLGVARTPWQVYLRVMLVPAFFILAGLPAVALSVTTECPSGGYWLTVCGIHLGFTSAGLSQARDILTRTLGAVSCMCFLALSTPMPDLIGFLRRCRVPALFLDLLALIYRFVFVLLETGLAMQRAQALRLGYITPGTGFRSAGCLFANLFMRAQHRAHSLYVALSTRGYEGRLDVVEKPYRLSVCNVALSAVTGGWLLVLAVVTRG
ncbi:MAG: cobalt ECF transporter T component CbiQ [Thermoanaerobacterales bacterium]|nr:cobalt ECF transporter T component CbiQ [Bacillota bacterium]MDI6906957.1 cobalt ECF transporter T component CbiQ [Thermoanaerobacterales bacterium]